MGSASLSSEAVKKYWKRVDAGDKQSANNGTKKRKGEEGKKANSEEIAIRRRRVRK
jgi:hypothetical protein